MKMTAVAFLLALDSIAVEHGLDLAYCFCQGFDTSQRLAIEANVPPSISRSTFMMSETENRKWPLEETSS